MVLVDTIYKVYTRALTALQVAVKNTKYYTLGKKGLDHKETPPHK